MFVFLWECMVLSIKVAIGSACWIFTPLIIIGLIGLIIIFMNR